MPKQKISKEDELKLQVGQLLSEEQELQRTAEELARSNPAFVQFLQQQQDFKQKSDLFWETFKNEMIASDIKSIKSPAWGSITIAEKTTYSATEKDLTGVPPKFIKKVLDTTKVSAHVKLSGTLPKGVQSVDSKYLTKRIKIKEINED